MREELDEAGRLRAENAALRARVEALEKALAERSNGHAQSAAAPEGTADVEALDALEGLPTAVPAVIQWRLDGAVTYWNDSAERLFGWSASEAVGRRLADLVGAGAGVRLRPGGEPLRRDHERVQDEGRSRVPLPVDLRRAARRPRRRARDRGARR
jgi:PAS domain-containing protein